jgi:septum formation topological specificity factor MinE
MRYQIAENRLENILQRDKVNDPQRVCEILKSEINSAIGGFLTLSHPIDVRFKKDGERIIFDVEIAVERVKSFGYLPN